MALSDRKIKKLAEKADSLLSSALREDVTKANSDALVGQALACMDKVLKEAPPADHNRFALQRVDMLCRARWFLGPCWYNWCVPLHKKVAVFSEGTVNQLAREAEKHLAAGEYPKALALLDTVVGYSAPSAHYLTRRAGARFAQGDHDGAVGDVTGAIELEPDSALHYLRRAWFRSPGLSGEDAGQSLADFQSALQRDPTLVDAWIGSIALNMLLASVDWDEVISLCGQARPFLSHPSDKAVGAWLLCVALLFAGDPVGAADLDGLKSISVIRWPPVFEEVFDAIEKHASRVHGELRQRIRSVNALVLERLDHPKVALGVCCGWRYWDQALSILVRHLPNGLPDAEGWLEEAQRLAGSLTLAFGKDSSAPARYFPRLATMVRSFPQFERLVSTEQLVAKLMNWSEDFVRTFTGSPR